jgi:DNA-binding response OmpR family regulator
MARDPVCKNLSGVAGQLSVIAGKQEWFTITLLIRLNYRNLYKAEDSLSWSVLVVDDEPMARTLLRLMLVRAGYEVVEAEDGFDALDKVKDGSHDVMLLDVMMPGLDGFSVCQTVREDSNMSELPIILLSAKTDLESVNKGLKLGANKYLTKPVSPEELAQQVKDVLKDKSSSPKR